MGYCNARGDGVRVRVLGAARLEAGQVLLHDIDGDAAVFVARDARGLYALSAVCTHQCCIVSLCGGRDPLCLHTVDDPGPGLVTASAVLAAMGPAFHCICHNSAYDAAGVVLSGPSIRPLPSLSACIDGDDVMVDTSRVVPADTRQ
jgi:Rieske Fe-S protein